MGVRPRPRWGNSQRSPDPLAGFEENGREMRQGGRGGRVKGKG